MIVETFELFVGDSRLPKLMVWRDAFSDLGQVTVSDVRHATSDAALVSAYRCEPYGCRAGSSEAAMGTMELFDTWKWEEPNRSYPRLLISNAVWRDDPPLLVAIGLRLNILREFVGRYNRVSTNAIRSLTIECAVLGFWSEAPDNLQTDGVYHCRRIIGDWVNDVIE